MQLVSKVSNSAKDGPFNDCGSITNPCFMTWDPEDHNLLYDAEDAGDAEGVGQGIRCLTSQTSRSIQ